jgi:hypothetical protein
VVAAGGSITFVGLSTTPASKPHPNP